MAKNQTPTPVAPAPVAPVAFPVTINEFCAELSGKDKRVELIYAFSKSEEAEGHHKDIAENFQTRFEAFATKPV